MARGGLSFRRKKRLSLEIKQMIINYIIGCAASFLLGTSIVMAFGYTITNVGVSMEAELMHNQKVLVNRTKYFLFAPKTGDVVVFKQGSNAHLYIKRVVATPGDTVQILDGYLYVNGAMVKDGFDKIADPGIAEDKIKLGENEYFVLGDNRNNSEDSRSNTVGPIHRKQIIGKAWFALASENGNMKTVD